VGEERDRGPLDGTEVTNGEAQSRSHPHLQLSGQNSSNEFSLNSSPVEEFTPTENAEAAKNITIAVRRFINWAKHT